MAVAISAMAPNCLPSLHGPSRLSRASSAAAVPPPPPPPLFAEDYSQMTTPFTDDEFRALMRGHCDLLSSFSEDHLYSRLLFSDETLQLQAQLSHLQTPPLPLPSLDTLLYSPISDDDVDLLAPMFSDEEIQVLSASQQASELSSSAGSRSDVQAAGEKRKSPPWPSCISDDEDDDDMEEAGPPSPPPPPVKRSRRRREEDEARAARLQLREWHGTIAARILRRQFSAPEPSHGRTALGCQCLELSMADGGGACALHQDADRAWMCSAQGHVPLVGGPGEVLVPTMAAGNSKATVMQYARWRRSVWMPTRFYAQDAAQQGMAAAAAAAGRQPEDDWMMH